MNTTRHREHVEEDRDIYTEIDGVFSSFRTADGISEAELEFRAVSPDVLDLDSRPPMRNITAEAIAEQNHAENLGTTECCSPGSSGRVRPADHVLLLAPEKTVKAVSRTANDSYGGFPVKNLMEEFNKIAPEVPPPRPQPAGLQRPRLTKPFWIRRSQSAIEKAKTIMLASAKRRREASSPPTIASGSNPLGKLDAESTNCNDGNNNKPTEIVQAGSPQ